MKVVEHTGGARERCILIGMIVNPLVLGRIAVKWDGNLFASPWANLIAAWCVKHHKQYGKAPLKAIEGYFTEWQEDNQDSDTVQLVEKFLGTLSDEYAQADEINPDHLLDVAGRYFKKVRLASMFAQGQNDLEIGHIDKAEKRVVSYAQIELGAGAGIDLFRDREAVTSTFDARREPLIEYPDGLGVFFGSALARDSFVAFLGPEKSTKSFWQLDVAYRALLQRRKVALFEVGDMSESQVKLRFLTRVAGEPHTSPDGKWPHAVKCPSAVRLPRPGEEHAHVDFKERVFDGPLDAQRAWQACEDLMQNKVRSKKCYFRISVHANSSINVLGIRSVLEGWEADGWTPDVCIVDYADILAPPSGRMEVRDQINTTWKQLRALSQELHCLVVTATQADAESYDRKTLTRRNFSEDKRKLAHVTGLVGINVTAEEKELGLCRLNWIVLRESAYTSRRCCHVAGCLPLANPAVKSVY